MILLKTLLLLTTLALSLSACQGNPSRLDSETTVQTGYTPAIDSDEAGLWLQMDRSEQGLISSGSLINDKTMNDYLHQIMCKLAADLCADVRVYLVHIPFFNATMAPNGVMQIWSGLLLRAENEAQLAYIMGHEIAHYRYQHSLQMFRQAKATANILAPFNIVTGAAGIGYVGLLTNLAAAGSLTKFSRDHEREADSGGFEMVVAAGYDPRESARIWKGLLQEKEAMDESTPNIFFSTHPSSDERITTLDSQAALLKDSQNTWTVGVDDYNKAVEPLRFELLRDELRLRQFPATEILLKRLSGSNLPAAHIHFFYAEMYAARNEPGDRKKAELAYQESLKHEQAPSEAYRELAMIYMKAGRGSEAAPLFKTYLQKQPDAFDRNMVKVYIQRIRKQEIKG